jgi:predicted 3-demethylubiquinone-9 3-methyltransferase (glyoxalase superfamily)
MTKQKITTSLWFDMEAEEAMNFYVDVFNSAPHSKKDSAILSIQNYPENAEDEHLKGMNGKVLNGQFKLAGQQYICLDGGPVFKFNEAISLTVECEDQAELDHFWEKLSAVPESEQCGWCKDKYGLSWQIIPKRLGELMGDPDKEKAGKVLEALMKMHKIEVSELEKAYNG